MHGCLHTCSLQAARVRCIVPHDDTSLSGSLLIQQSPYGLSYSEIINDDEERIFVLIITSRQCLTVSIGQTLGELFSVASRA